MNRKEARYVLTKIKTDSYTPFFGSKHYTATLCEVSNEREIVTGYGYSPEGAQEDLEKKLNKK